MPPQAEIGTAFPYDETRIREMTTRMASTARDVAAEHGISAEAGATLVLAAVNHMNAMLTNTLSMTALGIAPTDEDPA